MTAVAATPKRRGRPPNQPRTVDREEPVTAPRARVRERQFKGGQALDKFAIPEEVIPEGMSWEWKTESVTGKENPHYMSFMKMQGWEPVPMKHYPLLSGYGSPDDPVRLDGLVLMERPVELTAEAQKEDRVNAHKQVRAKEQELYGTPEGGFDRTDEKGRPMVRVSKTVERGGGMAID